MLTIRPATHDDVPALHALAESWLLKNLPAPEDTGFLISNFSQDKYHAYIDSAEYFWVAEEDGQLGGFLLAYHSESIQPDEIVNSCLRYSVVEPFTLIKQICASGKVRGATRALYEKLFAEMSTDLALAAVVNEPLNTRSIEFHRKVGFHFLWDLKPPADYDGEIRTRSIWYVNKSKKLPQTRMAQCDKNDLLQQLIEKQHGITALYTHEDNLNWTKLGMLVTFMTAFMTAFAFLVERPQTPTNTWTAVMLITFGYVINFIFYTKLKSGLKFFEHHKKTLRRYDEGITAILPSLPSFLDTTTRKRSATVRVMVALPIFSMLIWTVCSALLSYRYFFS
ncbi:hypothetical protein PSI9734_01072 [Pseudidiomarina piscicola]|uniref:N-acetyltransferase domain-containing protein n=1 Tax=Pseudidiomarina piscicola TaxID=2614830 RepID=A0A6S6WJ63_9GAMM|nr:GNAT family N-acetyltransferase [Pseudidiomarina piscicola]CAB0150629.1 hypothetical protein PSI9734_01072 [Pseudidiomarina piscicola]VZT40131.1 hypothetical protein PSI9734_01072 [Pseudomonas aeruginosa]